MSTSLAEQLQRLVRPQTSSLERGKKRASLLFDPKEAAGLRKESVYEIGLNGLEELISKNHEFEVFKKTLFSLSSKQFERSIESKESNKKLNNHIRKFVLLLSPYFMLNCSYKALEWLVYQYSIHEYNKDDLLMLVLPYHETNIFVRAVQLLKIKDERDPWHFLRVLQKPGVHLPKQTLLNHAASSPHMINFVSNFILEIIKVHEKQNILTVAFNFYCSVFTGAIEYCNEVSEPIVTQMLPALLKGLNSDIPDFRAASYVITARLLTKCTLSEVILDKFVEKISEHKIDILKEEAVLLYLVIYQSHVDYKKIPENAIAEIVAQDWIPKILENLNNNGCFIYPFLNVLIRCLINNGLEDDGFLYRKYTLDLLDQLKIDEQYFDVCLTAILESVPTKLKKKSEEMKQFLIEILELLEKQYPEQFDKHIYNILLTTESDIRKTNLQKLLKNALVLRKKFDIFDKLYHPNALIRTEAVKFLSKNFNGLKEVEKNVLKMSLIDRLNDEDVNVVKEALAIAKNTEAISNHELKEILLKLLNKFYSNKLKWNRIMHKCLRMLCSAENSNDLKVILAILPIMFPLSKDEVGFTKLVMNSEFFSACFLFKNIEKEIDFNHISDYFTELFKAFNFAKNKGNLLELLATINELDSEDLISLQKYILAIVIEKVIPQNCPLNEVSPFLEILKNLLNNTKLKSKKAETTILDYLTICRRGKLPLSGFMDCISGLISKIEKFDIGQVDFCKNNDSTKFLFTCASIFYHNEDVYFPYIQKFHNSIFDSVSHQIDFMLNLAVFQKDTKLIDANEILGLIFNIEKNDTQIEVFNFKNCSIPYLLILMTASDKEIRKSAIAISKQMSQIQNPENKNSYKYLLDEVITYEEEIILDARQLPVILSNVLSSKTKKLIVENLVNIICDSDKPIYIIAGISEVLCELNNYEIFEKTSSFALSILTKDENEFHTSESVIISCNINRFDESIGKYLKMNSNITKFLTALLRNDKECLNFNNYITSPSLLFLEKVDHIFVSSLTNEMESFLLNSIIENSVISQDPKILLASNKLFKHITLNSEHVFPVLVKMKEIQIQKGNDMKMTRKRKASEVPTIEILDTLEWKKGIRVLELIQDKKKITNVHILIQVLFDILKKCLDFDEQSAVEYPKQLILSSILHCCRKLEGEKISDNIFNMELVVQCIRASPNPQTHHHALLVLAHCATIIPTQVLHHIMAIFTFMGSSVLRHDDAYSFQLITNIIDTVIPILVSDGDIHTLISVLRVFVDALLDVPEHRRITLYAQLLAKIEPEEHLHLFMLLVFLSHVIHSSQEKTKIPKHKFEDTSTLKRLDIAANLTREFPPNVIFKSCINLIQFLRKMPIEQENLDKDLLLIDLSHLTPKQFRHFKYTIVIFINGLITSKELVSIIVSIPDENLIELEPLFKDLIVNILSYIQNTNPIIDKYCASSQSQYWKALQHQCLEMLDGVNALLTVDMFLLVIKGLMTHSLINIRKRALDLLNAKLQHNPSFIEECQHEQVQDLVKPLVLMIDKLNTNQTDEEHVMIQTALFTLKLIIKNIGSKNPDEFVFLLEFITDLVKSGKVQGNVLASLILCLAELCMTLRARAIHCLPHFMPVILKLLKHQKQQESPTLLCLSLLTVISKILESLSLFISPYLKRLLTEISQLIFKWGNHTDDPKLIPFVHKLSVIKQKLGENISSRVLIPSIEESYTELIEKTKFDGVGPLMSILNENLTHNAGPSITANLPELTKFFINALEFRNEEKCELEQTNSVENQIIYALSCLVLKLSETTFRPLYYRIYDWAIKCEVKNDRIITFYNVSSRLAKHLKSLFVLFAGHFIDNAAKVLDACNVLKSDVLYFEEESKNILLLTYILETLRHVFKNTTMKFINKERFEILMQPIVDQLENTIDGIENLSKRNESLLTPCIVQFAVATADDALWKRMNYEILLKMRNSNPKIRLIALKCLTETVKQLGEDYLPLLPETIPFLSELLEDEDETVEKNCKRAIQEMEKVLGENLQKYF